MAGDWRETVLGTVVAFSNGQASPERADDLPYPVYGSNGIIGYAAVTNAQPHSIVIGRVGTYCGSLHYVKGPSWVTENAIRATAIGDNDPRYAYYLLATLKLNERRAGSGQPLLNHDILSRIEVAIPDSQEQRAIAHILGTLDDKIELNRRMSETLEEMARALFESWFVRFDPVRAKMEGRDPGLPSDLADLFSDRLVDSELGEIPEGWEVARAGDIFSVAIGKTPPRKEPQWFSTNPKDVRWMSIKDLGSARVFISRVSEYLTHEAVERFRVRIIPDCTVVLSFKLTVGRVAITDGKMVSNEAIAHFLPRSDTYLGPAYLYLYLRNYDYESLGSTSSIATAVNSDSVREIRILVPTAPVHETFHRLVWPWFLRVRELQRESRTLAALRDTLLPKLISGELRVQDAERLVAAAT